jgi:hypothetical protein
MGPLLRSDIVRECGAGSTLTASEFQSWFVKASPDARRIYHRGYLALDRLHGVGQLNKRAAEELDRLATLVLSLAEAGAGHLVQKKHGNADYSYGFVVASPRLMALGRLRLPKRRATQ